MGYCINYSLTLKCLTVTAKISFGLIVTLHPFQTWLKYMYRLLTCIGFLQPHYREIKFTNFTISKNRKTTTIICKIWFPKEYSSNITRHQQRNGVISCERSRQRRSDWSWINYLCIRQHVGLKLCLLSNDKEDQLRKCIHSYIARC